MAGGVFAAVGAGAGYGGGGEDCTCSGFGTERTFGTSRLVSIGGGSGGSPDLRNPCSVAGAVLAVAVPESGAAVDDAVAEVSPGAGFGEAAGVGAEGAPPSAGLACASSVAGGTGGGGGGGAGADTAGKPGRSFSSLYLAFVRSAIRLCVSFSRSATVSARLGGGGTVARFG